MLTHVQSVTISIDLTGGDVCCVVLKMVIALSVSLVLEMNMVGKNHTKILKFSSKLMEYIC